MNIATVRDVVYRVGVAWAAVVVLGVKDFLPLWGF
jgi:hypothetical protein